MLRRHRLIRMQIHQLMDASLFAASFWLAYVVRSDPTVIDLLGLNPVNEFRNYVWLYLILIPAAPFVLEASGLGSSALALSSPKKNCCAWPSRARSPRRSTGGDSFSSSRVRKRRG